MSLLIFKNENSLTFKVQDLNTPLLDELSLLYIQSHHYLFAINVTFCCNHTFSYMTLNLGETMFTTILGVVATRGITFVYVKKQVVILALS